MRLRRQAQIQQHQRKRRLVGQRCARAGGVVGFSHRPTLLPQAVGEQQTQRGVVVHHQKRQP